MCIHTPVFGGIGRFSEKRECGLRVFFGERQDCVADQALPGLILEVFGSADLGDEDLQLREFKRHHALHHFRVVFLLYII